MVLIVLAINLDDAQSVDTYQEKFYKLDSDCLKASQQLAKFTFFETNYIDWDEVKFSFASEVLDIKKSDIITFKKPYCDQIETEFRFDKSFDHLNVSFRIKIMGVLFLSEIISF